MRERIGDFGSHGHFGQLILPLSVSKDIHYLETSMHTSGFQPLIYEWQASTFLDGQLYFCDLKFGTLNF